MAELSKVTYRYPTAVVPALHHVNWTVPEGSFVVLAGGSGSGKSTLLRCLNGLVPHFSGGEFGGMVTVAGHDTRRYGTRRLSREVGFVFQDPESQLLTSRVDDEIAFSLEQHGIAHHTLRARVEEMLELLGIVELRERDPATLSGGERQRVAVAAALALHPRLLVLDEPTSQLDPWGAEDVLAALTRLNDDLGLTIVLAEHRLERVLSHADRLRYLGRDGSLTVDGPVGEVIADVDRPALPPVTRIGQALGWQPLPLSIKEGRALARRLDLPAAPPATEVRTPGAAAFALEGVSLAHDDVPVLKEIDLSIRSGELVALMGRNGSGKTTLLRALMGFHRPRRGRVELFGRDVTTEDPAIIGRDVGYLPQLPGSLLFANRVADELTFTLTHRRNDGHGSGRRVWRPFGLKDAQASGPRRASDHMLFNSEWTVAESVLNRFGLAEMAERHPRDLSGGERERVALAAVLAGGPRVLLLDEPTRGMDAWRKAELGTLLRELAGEGVAIVLATHDVELVASYATRVVLLGGGGIIADDSPRDVLAGSLTFSPQVNRLFGSAWLTVEDVLAALPRRHLAPPDS
ncbi:MAG: ATP-binding cassette domain-containing protein [Chloroflexia bacterium]|nr:ATP-binding cassette domain-containing protein [Chloroflexia bacterium]